MGRSFIMMIMCLLCVQFPCLLVAQKGVEEQSTFERPVAVLGLLGPISQIAYSPGGKLLAVACEHGIGLYDGQTLAARGVLQDHTAPVISVTFSPNGKLLASGSNDRTVRLWDIGQQEKVVVLEGHTGPVTSITFSPDGKLLASGGGSDIFSSDRTVRLWSVEQQKEVAVLEGHTRGITSITFSPDGKLLASGSDDETVRLWDVGQQKEIGVFKGHTRTVSSVVFSPDGKILASSGHDDIIILWDVGQQRQMAFLEGHTGEVLSLAFSPDGKLLVSGGGYLFNDAHNNNLRLWDVEKLQEVVTPDMNNGRVISLAFSSGSEFLLAAATADAVWLWNRHEVRDILWGHREKVISMVFSPDTRFLASVGKFGYNNVVLIWNIAQNKLQMFIEGYSGPLVFSPDGKLLAVSGNDDFYENDGTVRLWDTTQQKEIGVLEGNPRGRLSSIAFSPNGKLVAAGNILWDVNSQRIVATLKTDRVTSVAFSPDGKLLASGSKDATVRLWDVEQQRLIAILVGDNPVASVAFSPDGKLLASGGGLFNFRWGNTVHLWSVEQQKEVAVLERNTSPLAFSPDGSLLATGGYRGVFSTDTTVHLWDVAQQKEVATLKGHPDFVSSIAFSPDGKLLATGDEDGIVLLWVGEIPIVSTSTVVLEEYIAAQPQSFALEQNFPNPFNNSTIIRFDLPLGSDVELLVYNLLGQKVATLLEGKRLAGEYVVHWDGRDDVGQTVSSGVYFYRLEAVDQGFIETKQMLLLR